MRNRCSYTWSAQVSGITRGKKSSGSHWNKLAESTQRIAVVTGGSRGIGREIALALGAEGCFVCVNYRSRAGEAESVAQAITSKGGKAKAIAFDVANGEAITKGFETIENEMGGVDILINNAGISIDSLILRAKDEAWKSTIDTNLYGAFACTRAALKTMLRRKNGGRIIYLSSVVGQMGNAGQAIYATTKAGLHGLAKSIAREVASRGITANVVAPGFVKTEMTDNLTPAQKEALLKAVPLGRWAEPKEIADVVRFLASEKASYITGQVISVNGGMYL